MATSRINPTLLDELLKEYFFRRWGTGVATIIFTLLAVAPYLTIRRIEKRQAGAE